MMSFAGSAERRVAMTGRTSVVDEAGTTMGQSGWYADPAGRHERRFFNGLIWTSDVLDGECRGVDPVTASAPAQQPVAAQVGGASQTAPSSGWQPAPAQAWRDGDELVIKAGVPLPPICVFCGQPAVAGVRTAINGGGRPYAALQVASTRIPVCDEDRQRIRTAMITRTLTVAVLFVLMLFGIAPGWLGLVPNSVGSTAPTVGVVAIALATFVGVRLVRRLVRGSTGPARPTMLRIHRSRGGFIWLRNADPRCLAQLPPVAPAP